MWRPGFSYLEKQPARIGGYKRRFWQASPDHRGTVNAPGRVVTLVPMDSGSTEGIVYWVAPEIMTQVLSELDVREQGGYVQKRVEAALSNGDKIDCLTYFADQYNPHYLGPDSIDAMLTQIQQSVGPSGANSDYLLDLASTLRQYGLVDEHVFELEAGLRLRLDSHNIVNRQS